MKPALCTIVLINKDLHKLHRMIIILLSSILNKTSNLVLYIRIDNTLININQHTGIPKEYLEFVEMIEYLKLNLKIKDKKGRVCMCVIKNNIDEYLEPNTYKIKLHSCGLLLTRIELKDKIENGDTFTFYMGDIDDIECRRVCDYKMSLEGVCIRLIGLLESVLDL